MVIDYRHARRAFAARRLLADAGVQAVYTPDALVAASDDPAATHLLLHRIEVPAADAERAAVVLREYGLSTE